MMKSWQFWTVMAGITAMTGLFAFGFTKNPREVPSPLVGKPAPNFSVTEMNTGEPLTLAKLKGTPVVLNFWASWCVACQAEAPRLQAAHIEYERRRGAIRMIGIAIQDTLEDARAFARNHGKTYYLALDSRSGDISLNYGLYGVPETFFIDGDGILRYKHIGEITWDVLESQIRKLIESDR
jgi:cytochrome c biogenesis protein CcmG/thiol:disulfide interchange protein DsbE